MMEIKEVQSNDGTRVFKNVDLRDIGYGESVEVVLSYDSPLEITTKYGLAYNIKFMYKDQEVSALIGGNFKTDKFGVSLASKIKEYKSGDRLKISKEEGKTKDQRNFRFFTVNKLGEESLSQPGLKEEPSEQAQPSQPSPSVGQSEVKLNLNLPTDYTDKEQALIDNLKRPEFSHYNKEQKIEIITQNGISEGRAIEIVNSNFQ